MRVLLVAFLVGLVSSMAAAQTSEDCSTKCPEQKACCDQAVATTACQDQECCAEGCGATLLVSAEDCQGCPLESAAKLTAAFKQAQVRVASMDPSERAALGKAMAAGCETCPMGKRFDPTLGYMQAAVAQVDQLHQEMARADLTGVPEDLAQMLALRAQVVSSLNEVLCTQRAALASVCEGCCDEGCSDEVMTTAAATSCSDQADCDTIVVSEATCADTAKVAAPVSSCGNPTFVAILDDMDKAQLAAARLAGNCQQPCTATVAKAGACCDTTKVVAVEASCCADETKAVAAKSCCADETKVVAAAEKSCCADETKVVAVAVESCCADGVCDTRAVYAALKAARSSSCCQDAKVELTSDGECTDACCQKDARTVTATQACTDGDVACCDEAKLAVATDSACSAHAKLAVATDAACSAHAKLAVATDASCSAHVKLAVATDAACCDEAKLASVAGACCDETKTAAVASACCEAGECGEAEAFSLASFEDSAAKLVKCGDCIVASWKQVPVEFEDMDLATLVSLTEVGKVVEMHPAMQPSMIASAFYADAFAKLNELDAMIMAKMEECGGSCTTFQASHDLLAKAGEVAAAMNAVTSSMHGEIAAEPTTTTSVSTAKE